MRKRDKSECAPKLIDQLPSATWTGLLEIYLFPTDKLATKDFREAELATIVTDRKKRTLKQLMMTALLTRAGLADEQNPIKIDAVITSGDLGKR